MKRFAATLFIAGMLAATGLLGLACEDQHLRDQWFGTDAGTNFKPGEFDAPIDAPDGAEADGAEVDAAPVDGAAGDTM